MMENNEAGIGDTVQSMETRPLSKQKRWRLVKIRREGQIAGVRKRVSCFQER